MRHDQQLVTGMEMNQFFDRTLFLNKVTPSLIHKHPLNEIFSHDGIMKPSVINDRDEREMLHKGPSEYSGAFAVGHSRRRINFYAPNSWTGGFALENKAAQFLVFQLLTFSHFPLQHPFRVVDSGTDCNQPGRFRFSDKPHGFPRDAQATLDLRAYRHPRKVTPKGIRDIAVMLMSPVISHIVTQ